MAICAFSDPAHSGYQALAARTASGHRIRAHQPASTILDATQLSFSPPSATAAYSSGTSAPDLTSPATS